MGIVRIIGGRFRGRIVHFPDAINGLRPTPDRVRETLFNWLMHDIHGARCLDLFAGTGVLGLEALSRGASHVTLVEKNPIVIRHLQQLQQEPAFNAIEIIASDALASLKQLTGSYDIIFLDPPFHQALIQPICQPLEQSNLLAKQALIYIESEPLLDPLPIPATWNIKKSKVAGNVCYSLVSKITSVL